MAGIYIHIPFCRQACHYCDFHFSTNLGLREEMLTSIQLELESRRDYLSKTVDTIYFGGGTPSILSGDQIDALLTSIHTNYSVSENPEITLEANPEDLSLAKSNSLFSAGINRLSIGIQTFSNKQLKWMNRVHDTHQSYAAIENVRTAGFHNLSLDLMYALPEHGIKAWEADLREVITMSPAHISLYGLTIESRTVFGNWLEKGRISEVEEEEAAQQYLQAIELLDSQGYHQYEVSNFGKEGMHSRHNHGYWMGIPYLGVGPGAHSFNGQTRRFNVRSNAGYIKSVKGKEPYFEEETLSTTQLANERIMTGLRTALGINFRHIDQEMQTDFLAKNKSLISKLEKSELIKLDDESMRLTPLGYLVADEIALQLFFEE